MTISGNLPAEIADRMAAPTDDQIDDDARLRARALNDLCDLLMAGDDYMRSRSRFRINLIDILAEGVHHHRLADYLCAFLYRGEDSQDRVRRNIEQIVRDRLRDSAFHEQRIAEMREEEREENE